MRQNEIIKINNEPDYAKDYEFIVARYCEGEYWFYGAYENGFFAAQVAESIENGIIFHNVRIQGVRRK